MPNIAISESQLKDQAKYYYMVFLLWPLYLFFLPPIFVHFGYFALIYMIFPGIYLFTWAGFLMHESWHRYVPTVNNRFFYSAFAYMILSDPQVYRLIHGHHHSQVHSYLDAEFHPLGEIHNRLLRVGYNCLEILLGVAFLVSVESLIIRNDPRFSPKYRLWKLPISICAWAVFIGAIGFLSHLAFGVTFSQIALPMVLSFWLNSFVLHQSQLIEHGNLIVKGNFEERNLWTRNLKAAGILEKVFLFLTHNDSREHVLHHTQTKLYLRPFPGKQPLPPEAKLITLRDYVGILTRMMMGIVDIFH